MTSAQITRRSAIVALSGSARLLRAGATSRPLLAGPEDFIAASQKAARNAWANVILTNVIRSAEAQLVRPISVPDRGGQWGHWYACPKDGVPLVTDSPTRHRCPLCGTVYTGEPYDSVYIGRIHDANSNTMRDCGVAFAFTNRREFAVRAGALLTAYADRYLSYPRHDNNGKDTVTAGRLTSQTLDESTWLIPVVWAYTLVRDTLSPASRTHIETALLRPATETIIGPSFDHLPNIQCWKNSAVGCVGYALEDQGLISTALENPVRGFRTLMSRDVVEGGLWIEGSLGYQHYALQALWPLAEAARRNGTDLYANENYRSLFDGPIGMALPNGDPPGFNDNPGENLARWSEVYELAFVRWKEPRYGRVLQLGPRNTLVALLYGEELLPKGDCIPKASVSFNKAGFAALRSPKVTVAVRFGLHGGGHGHPDMLNIVTFAEGKIFGVDPGSIGYGAPLHREWYRSTIAHNTVSVDQQLQSNADGHGISWSQDATRTIWKGAADVYPGVRFERELILNGVKITDRFICESDADHVYDWAFHSAGSLGVSVPTVPHQLPIGSTNGYQHIKQLGQASTSRDWTARWAQENITLTLHVKGVPDTIVMTGTGPGRNPAESTPLLIIRRKAARTIFEVEHVFS
jgi:Heparinase II/III-like protein/Alginate lyase